VAASAAAAVSPARILRMASDILPEAPADRPTVDGSGAPLPPRIDGVEVVRLRRHEDHRGTLTPIVDLEHEFWRDGVVYSYCFTIDPGRIKGWGMHRHQDDRYAILAGRVRVALHDGRVDSPTHGTTEALWFSAASPGLVRIPAGVWHADQNCGDAPAVLMNFPTRPFDPARPDKHRLDPHGGAIPFDWALRDG
jgi:dTDP-4-dehydrorhamnose 3,5-epimerase